MTEGHTAQSQGQPCWRRAHGPTIRKCMAQTMPTELRAAVFAPSCSTRITGRIYLLLPAQSMWCLTSKHHEGFALWPSKEASATWGRPWNAVETGPKRDVLGDLSEAVRRKGLRMGYYYSLYEWYNPLWLTDKPRYLHEHMFPQFKDLVTRYKPSHHFQRWRVGADVGGMAESGAAGVAVQRFSGERRCGDQRPLGQRYAP